MKNLNQEPPCFQVFILSLFFLMNFSNSIRAQDTMLAPPKIQLSHLEIQGEFVDFKKLKETSNQQRLSFGDKLYKSFDSVAAYQNYPLGLKLPPKLNDLTFHFSANDWHAQHKIKYSYYLAGLERTWGDPQALSKATYSNLPSGNYTFKVRATGANQQWSEPLEYHFKIRPFWWLSWWSISIYALALAATGKIMMTYWNNKQQRKKEIQKLIQEHKLLSFSSLGKTGNIKGEDSFLILVNQTLEVHLSDENFGIAELCEQLKISRTQLHRKLKSLTGQSTSHYIRSLRLEIAKGVLEKTQLNISEVAFTVGFSSPAYFSKVFKQEFGYPPRDIR